MVGKKEDWKNILILNYLENISFDYYCSFSLSRKRNSLYIEPRRNNNNINVVRLVSKFTDR